MKQQTVQQKPQVAIVQSERGELAVMPIQQYQELAREANDAKASKTGWIILASCSGASLLLMAVGWVASRNSPPAIAVPTPSPVVIEKPVIVDRNCLLFCSK